MRVQPWTGKEEHALIGLYAICNSPQEVSSRMPGRTPRACVLKAIELRKRGVPVRKLLRRGINLMGRRYGSRVVVGEGMRGNDGVLVMRCDCGNEALMRRVAFGSGRGLTCRTCNSTKAYHSGRCAPPSRAVDRTGHRFGSWTAIKRKPMMGDKWLFKCDCGTLAVRRVCNVKRQISCGCHRNPDLANRDLLTDFQRLTLMCD